MELAEALKDPRAYPFPVRDVTVRQTHISWVFLAGAFAYKIKKPVNLGFLDYSGLERRRFYCTEEVRLNRRLAPDVYLGVVPITGTPAEPQVEGQGHPIEYAVKMRRLPEERMWDHLLAADLVGSRDVERLAAKIARFHADGDAGPDIARYGDLDVIRGNWEENFAQVGPYVGRTLSSDELGRCRAFVEEELADAETFESRKQQGRIREGHGDLRAESVWMGDDGSFEVVDCIEFNERFRYGDVASEVAFLAADLDWRGRPDLAWTWVDHYERLSADPSLRTVLPFYKCYRAFVRGKVESMVLDDPGFTRQEWQAHRTAARQHFRLVELYATRLLPTLILVCGRIGSGKTTVAQGLASLLGLPVLSSDMVRKEIAGLPWDEHAPAALDAGLYRPETRRAVYGEMYRRAALALREHQSVILDAAFGTREERSRALAVAERCGVDHFVLETTAPQDVSRRRLVERQRDQVGASDAGAEIFDRTRARFEAPTEVPPDHFCRLHLNGPRGTAVNAAIAALLHGRVIV